MSSSSPSHPSASTTPSPNQPNQSVGLPATEAKTNESTFVCNVCKTVIMLKNMATEWINEERELPLQRQKKGIDSTETEVVQGYFGVKDMFAFENIGFTRSAAGKRFLVCGECEQGPVGFVDSETQMNYVAPSRMDTQ
uniref:Uncharacterized protein n=1 Tax=Caenorhabditis japonica TaxID=281687 RepID=A0A8R1DFX6_CAEJA